MLFLIALIIAACIAVFLGKPLKKYPAAFYIIAVIISAAAAIFDFKGAPDFVSNYIIALFSRGALATGLWAVIMWTGALPNGSKAIKTLMPIRGELSILAALLTLGHNIRFGKIYFLRMFTAPQSMSGQQLAAGIISIIMLVIMLPLTVMSFPKIRKKMNPKTWKRIQRSAYVFYALIYVHVMILTVPSAVARRSGYLFSVIVYSIVFISYAAFRVRKHIIIKKKPETKTALNFCSSGAAVILCAAVISIALPKAIPVNTINAAAKPENISFENSQDSSVILTASLPENETSQSCEILSESESQTIEPDNSMSAFYSSENESQSIESENPAPESEYIYSNGTYSACAYGYDGDIFVTITIENDKIISINADTEESDPWYFDSAADTVISQIDYMLDLGSVAKGYTGDKVISLFKESGITSAIISLGGNVHALGSKPDGSPWKVALIDPNSPQTFIGNIEISDKAVITSGCYERYFVGEDGKQYCHIINPFDGYPADNGIASVTVIGSAGILCDALSTALFVMGKEAAIEHWREHNDFEMIIIEENGEITVTEGIKSSFSLSDPRDKDKLEVVTYE